MRCFIAIDIDDIVRKQIDGVMSRLKKGAQFTSCNPNWVAAENLHITLKFLGEIEESRVDDIKNVLAGMAETIIPFEISMAKLGVFPNKVNPKVVWIGIENGKEEVVRLQRRLEREIVNIGFEPEERAFTPHLTIARLRALRGTSALVDIISSHSAYSAGSCIIKEITLYKSVLKPTGAEYTSLITIPFGVKI